MLDACRAVGHPVTSNLGKSYFAENWLVPDSSAACGAPTTRFGPDSEGGKVLCDAANRQRGLGSPHCRVVSVGLNDDTRAEQGMHAAFPHCAIEGYDGTLNAAKRAKLPPPETLRVFEYNFNASTYKRYEGGVVSLLKIDCEGCELHLLAPWLDRVCTEQIAMEIHGCNRLRRAVGSAPMRLSLAHALLVRLHREYIFFHREPNPLYPDGCIEFSLRRRWPCETPA